MFYKAASHSAARLYTELIVLLMTHAHALLRRSRARQTTTTPVRGSISPLVGSSSSTSSCTGYEVPLKALYNVSSMNVSNARAHARARVYIESALLHVRGPPLRRRASTLQDDDDTLLR